MKPNVIKRVVVVVLFLGAGFLFWFQMQPTAEEKAVLERARANRGESAKKAPAPAVGKTTAPATTKAPKDNKEELALLLASVQQVEFDFNAERPSRDPMRPLVGATAPARIDAPSGEGEPQEVAAVAAISIARRMVLTGIVYDEDKPLAVVDNEVVYPGYEFPSGVVVDAIEPTGVRLRVDDQVITLDLEEL